METDNPEQKRKKKLSGISRGEIKDSSMSSSREAEGAALAISWSTGLAL